jgi:hypothetical protein
LPGFRTDFDETGSSGKKKGRASGTTLFQNTSIAGLALTGFEPALRLVNNIDAALTAHDAAIAVALLERAEGVTYLHGVVSYLSRRADCALGYNNGPKAR